MLKIFSAALLTACLVAGAANARGGAEPMPLTNYTDLPNYHPAAEPFGRTPTARKRLKLHQSTAHDR